MGRKLRIFVASTMKDLANERDAVVTLLSKSNFEPVHAENFQPPGHPWDRIRAELDTCDLFLLLCGETYGFVPDEGPAAEHGKSVTHLEYDEARRLGLPVLPFLKRLDRDACVDERRDAFHAEIGRWDGGQVARSFELASDLATGVLDAIVSLLTDEFCRARVQARAPGVSDRARALRPPAEPGRLPDLPAALVEAVRSGDTVLVSGAGLSREAGYPGVFVHEQALLQAIRRFDPDYAPSPAQNAFPHIAEDLEEIGGREELVKAVRDYMFPAEIVAPAPSHVLAVKLFPRIVTTNYSTLFEEACEAEGRPREVVTGPLPEPPEPPVLVKVRGSAARPETLVLTASQEDDLRSGWAPRFNYVVDWLSSKTVVVVGSSLVDRGMHEMFRAAEQIRGYYVMPAADSVISRRMTRLGLLPILTSGELFFRSLDAAQGQPAARGSRPD
ncbi:MAG: DUF4062 domain-containing protein [Planctomycetota bacterium]